MPRGSGGFLKGLASRLAAALILFGAPAAIFPEAQNTPLVKAVVKPASATVGAPLEYRINIAGRGLGPKDIDVLLPENRECYPEKEAGDRPVKKNGDEEEDPAQEVPLYVISKAAKDDRSVRDMLDLSVVLDVAYFRPGRYSLPEIEIRDRRGEKIAYELPVIEIKETNAQGALEEIEPPLDLGGNHTRLILLVAGVIAATLITVFAVYYIRKKRAENAARVEPVPPLEVFLRDMAKLGAPSLIAQNRVEEYVFGVSMVFRKYLSAVYDIDATEMTSDEIDHLLKKVMPARDYSRYGDAIMQSFHLWDLSKFAEFAPSREILEANLEKTEKLARNLSREETVGPA